MTNPPGPKPIGAKAMSSKERKQKWQARQETKSSMLSKNGYELVQVPLKIEEIAAISLIADVKEIPFNALLRAAINSSLSSYVTAAANYRTKAREVLAKHGIDASCLNDQLLDSAVVAKLSEIRFWRDFEKV